MSTDKLNNLVASDIEFVTGERLKAEKLNYLIELLETNINHLGAAVGDIYDENVSLDLKERSQWGKQFDSNNPATGAQKRRFDIANLARLIGPASNLNPQNIANTGFGFSNISENIPVNKIEYCTKYPVLSILSISDEYTRVFSREALVAGKNYYIENSTIYFAEPTVNELTLNYTTNPSFYNGGPSYQGASFNVYPDPNQDDSDNKLIVNYNLNNGNVSYTIILPTIKNQQGSFADRFETTSLDNRDINFDAQLMWPEWIQDLGNLEEIPKYSLYLKNYTLNESYLDATYTKISNTEILVTNLQIGDQDCINEFDLRVVTVGTDITTSIDDLRNKMFLHKHDGSFGEPKINIKDIVGFYEVEAPSGPYYPSSADWNPLSGYLHRDGYQADSDIVNGDNAMRGPLMMGLTSFDPISSREIVSSGAEQSGTSQSIQFGNNYKLIYGSDDVLVIDNIIGKLLLNQNLQIHTYNYNNSDYVNPFATVGSLIENVNAFQKIKLTITQTNFEVSLVTFENVAGTLSDNGASGGGLVENNYILKAGTNNFYWLDWKQLREDSNVNLKSIFNNFDNIDTFIWRENWHAGNTFFLEVSSTSINPEYFFDLTSKLLLKDGVTYKYNPVYRIDPSDFQFEDTNGVSLVINRFKNYYSIYNESLDTLIKSEYSITIYRDEQTNDNNVDLPFYLFFNYNGKISNGEYVSSLNQNSDIIFVENQKILIWNSDNILLNTTGATDKFAYIYYPLHVQNSDKYHIMINVEEIYNPRFKTMEINLRPNHIDVSTNYNIHD